MPTPKKTTTQNKTPAKVKKTPNKAPKAKALKKSTKAVVTEEVTPNKLKDLFNKMSHKQKMAAAAILFANAPFIFCRAVEEQQEVTGLKKKKYNHPSGLSSEAILNFGGGNRSGSKLMTSTERANRLKKAR